MFIGIRKDRWRRAEYAAHRIQRRRDEIDTEALLDDAGILDEDERAGFSSARCACGELLLVAGDYTPYAPVGVLTCQGCIENASGTCDGPGAIIRE